MNLIVNANGCVSILSDFQWERTTSIYGSPFAASSSLFPSVAKPVLLGSLGGKSLLPNELGFSFEGGKRGGAWGRMVKALPGGASFYHKTVKFTIIDFIISALTIYCKCVPAE